MLITGSDPQTGPYFAAMFRPRLGEQATARAKVARRAVFLVDTSLSSNPDRFNVWLKLLRALLDENRGQLKQFAVLFFNIEGRWWRKSFVDNTPANVKILLARAQQLALEGATDLGAALRTATAPPGLDDKKAPLDLFLLSDGSATWGESDLHAMAAALTQGGQRTLYAYDSGLAGTDRRALAQLTRATGGAMFSVVGEAELKKAATAHRTRPWRLLGMKVAGASDLMLAGRPKVLFAGQTLRLVGRGQLQAGATVSLELTREGKKRVVSVPLPRAVSSTLAARSYGQVAVDQLEELKHATEAVSVAYACHFRVTGQTSSLVMLESEADYRRFKIKPQEHAFVVKSKPAALEVARVLERIGKQLGDAKLAFLSWIQRMTRVPGVSFEVPTALKIVLEKMPPASFTVKQAPLRSKDPSWASVSGSLREQLRNRKLEYRRVVQEAVHRKAQLGPADALRALSSLVENSPGDVILARDVGYSAAVYGFGSQAYHLFRRVAAARPHEPQTYRAMANLLASMGRADLALAYYEVGMAGKWAARFGEFRRILTLDYLRFLRSRPKGLTATDFAAGRARTLARSVDVQGAGLLVSITWNTDNSDVDLHVLEPTGETCFYSNRSTKIGGQLTLDVTRGYGPEMYVLRQPKAGTYRISVKYFARNQNRASARTKVQATVYRNWGTAQETRVQKVVTLVEGKQMHDIMTVKVD
jgi:hypothetical protein